MCVELRYALAFHKHSDIREKCVCQQYLVPRPLPIRVHKLSDFQFSKVVKLLWRCTILHISKMVEKLQRESKLGEIVEDGNLFSVVFLVVFGGDLDEYK